MIPVELLIIEDNEADVLLIREFLKDCAVPLDIAVANDGEAALDMLSHAAPDLILLDLGLPKVGGREVLRSARANGHATTPILILSSSQNPNDVREIFRSGANGFIPKCSEMLEFQEEVHLRIQPWIEAISRVKNAQEQSQAQPC
jgi:CheY-like chemotaxis protein